MDRWAVILVMALALVSGLGWLRLFRLRSANGPQHLGAALACGTAWLGTLTVLLSPFALFRPLVVLPLLLLPVLGFLRPRGDERATAWWRGWLGFLPALALVGLSMWLAVQRPVWTVDAHRRWVLHAQWTAHEHTATPDSVADQEWAAAHPAYPPLVPGVLALALQLGGDRAEGMRPAFPLFFLGLLAVVHGYAYRRGRAFAATVVSLALASTPALSLVAGVDGAWGLGADHALADVPLAFLATAFLVLLLEGAERLRAGTGDERATWCAAGLAGLGVVFTKNEGLVYAPACALVFLLVALAAGRSTPLARARRGALAVLATLVGGGLLWKLVARNMPVRIGEEYLSVEVLGSFAEGASRAGEIVSEVALNLGRPEVWSLAWIVLPALWLVGTVARFRRLDRTDRAIHLLPFLWLVAGVAMVAGAYVVTGWRGGDWRRLMDVSLARLLIHHLPLVFVLAADLLRPDPVDEAEPGTLPASSPAT